MHPIVRFVVAAVVIAAVWTPVSPGGATGVWRATADLTEVPPRVYGADDAHQAQIHAAVERFHDAGLRLPPLRIFVHSSTDACQDQLGTFGQFGQRDRIDLCTSAAFYILHEMAHAWEQHTLTDGTRRIVLAETGLTVWHDRELPWLDSGAEVAANTIAFGLLDAPLEDRSGAFTPQLDRFRLLTGANSPRIE